MFLKNRYIDMFAVVLIIMSWNNLTVAANPSGSAPAASEMQTDKTDVEISKVELVPYTAKNRRDPFASIIIATKTKMEKKKKSLNPLENFDVTDFKLMGIIFDGKRYYASVVLPDKKAYTLKAGMKVGLYGGKVENIMRDSIIFNEYVMDYMGVKRLKKTELKLRKEEEQ